MQANAIWPGAEYAYEAYATRGGRFNPNAKRCRVIRKFEEQKYGNKRMSTYCEIMPLDAETGEMNGAGRRTIEARTIIGLWDDYENELQAYRLEREEADRKFREEQEKRRKEREERDAVFYVAQFIQSSWKKELDRREEVIRQEEQRKKQQRVVRLRNVMITHGFNRDKVVINEFNKTVSMGWEEMERWLGIKHEGD